MKREITIGIGILGLILTGLLLVSFVGQKKTLQNPAVEVTTSTTAVPQGTCLTDDEYADYEINKKINEVSSAVISIKNKSTNKVISSFKIEVPIPDHYHPIEFHKCGVYALRIFDYNYVTKATGENYRVELWAYDYNGRGMSLLRDPAKWSYQNVLNDFRIDPTEKYAVLEQPYLGSPNYALIIKDLKTSDTVFTLNLSDLLKQYPSIQQGSFDLGVWTDDGKYLWGSLYDGPFETAWYRIEAGTWKVDIFPPPPGIQSGVERAWNFGGWIAYADITSFTGDSNVTNQIEQDATSQGQQKHLWLYNFFTKQKTLIVSVDPSWHFDINLSETVLTYHLPGQATSTYTLPQ